MAVPADGVTLDDKRATTDAAAARGRRHPRAQHRAQAPVGDQGRLAGGARRAARAATLAISDVVGDDLSVIASGRPSPTPSRFEDALDVLRAVRRRRRVSAGGRRAPAARRAAARCRRRRSRATRASRGTATTRDRRRGATRWPARRREAGGARLSRRCGSTSRSSARRGRRRSRTCARCWRAARGARPARVRRLERRDDRARDRAAAGAAAIRNSRSPRPSRSRGSARRRRSPASAPTASTVRPTRPARSPIRRRSARARAAGLVPGPLSRRQQCLRVFRRAGRSHPHRSDRHERRRPSSNSVSLNSDVFTRSSPRAHAGAGAPSRRHARAAASAQGAARRPRVVQAARQVARRVGRAHSDSRATASGCPRRWTSTSAGCRRNPAGYGFVTPERPLEPARRRHLHSRPAPRTRRCTATASSCASSASRTAAAPRGGSSASSSARTGSLVGRYDRDDSGMGYVVPFDRRVLMDIFVPPGQEGGAAPGEMVTVELTRWPTATRGAIGRVAEVLGDIDAPGVDTEIIIRKYGIPDAHSRRGDRRGACGSAASVRGEGHPRPHRLPRRADGHDRRRARARLRRCDHDREAAERQLLARRAHRRRVALRAGGQRARPRGLRARHVGVLPRARRAHVPVGAGDRAVQPQPARRSPGAVVPHGGRSARRRSCGTSSTTASSTATSG